MPELIDKNALKARLRGCVIIMPNGEKCMADRAIDTQGTIDAEPVKHGKWMNTNETVWDAKEIDCEQKLEISIVSARCSVCNRWAEQVNNFPPYMKYALCPHCGAKMQDGGAENAEM